MIEYDCFKLQDVILNKERKELTALAADLTRFESQVGWQTLCKYFSDLREITVIRLLGKKDPQIEMSEVRSVDEMRRLQERVDILESIINAPEIILNLIRDQIISQDDSKGITLDNPDDFPIDEEDKVF